MAKPVFDIVQCPKCEHYHWRNLECLECRARAAETRLAACEALVGDVKLLAHILSRPAFEGSTEPSERAWDSSGKDAGGALFAILKKHEAAIRGETNDEQAG